MDWLAASDSAARPNGPAAAPSGGNRGALLNNRKSDETDGRRGYRYFVSLRWQSFGFVRLLHSHSILNQKKLTDQTSRWKVVAAAKPLYVDEPH
jgi:hypothetical protein